MSSRNVQKWTEKTHEDILIEIFQSVTLSPADLQKMMDGLKAKGYTFSESALRYALFRLTIV